MNTLGLRLKQERKRLGMTQPDFALIGGVEKGTQINYEQDKRFPDAKYLLAVAAIGVDTNYVLHGEPSKTNLSEDETELLFGYRGLDVRGKAGVLSMIETLGSGPSIAAREKQAQLANTTVTGGKITGKKAQVIQGNNMTGTTTIHLSRKKKDAV